MQNQGVFTIICVNTMPAFLCLKWRRYRNDSKFVVSEYLEWFSNCQSAMRGQDCDLFKTCSVEGLKRPYSVAWLYVWFRSLQWMRKYHPWNLKSLEIILKNHHNTCWPYLVIHWYVVQIFVVKHRFSQKVTSGFHLCMTEAVPHHREAWNLGV